ncbi:MAG TPA: DUF485 domain-containing protein [Clostridiales bacterium]|nr:DUF485 domain-containing protein [Clostridiales bacterium]
MHGESTNWKKDNASSLKELLGKWFFLLYALIYAGFILLNVLSPEVMAMDIGSLNIAIVYGFGLILFAIFLSFVYNHVGSHAEQLLNKDEETSGEEVCGK